ncbi:hypothetical protein EVAR_101385_1 [Eumeta japonica]|uniref:Uncharacterized protein n=1 Tax=Eumeta variegata TaxID=151549 RepID=A0A4C1SRE6_EUMVA|nr:hypothetical protein EVAR_101385_1 [Eumeta japonica]
MCLRVFKGSSVAVAYQHSVLGILGMVVVKLRHDAHLSASSQLFAMPGLVKASKGRKGASPKLLWCQCILNYNISSKLLPVIGKYARHGLFTLRGFGPPSGEALEAGTNSNEIHICI